MAWVRRNLLTFAAMVTLFILLLPNVVVALFSFNKPNGRYNYEWVRPSADACTSTNRPSPVITRFMSVAAAESSA